VRHTGARNASDGLSFGFRNRPHYPSRLARIPRTGREQCARNLNSPASTITSTIESKTNFFAAVRGGHVEGVTLPLHVGRRTIVVQTDVRDATGRRVAQVTQTQAVLVD
jgi:uncharacterized protein (TIGR00369 family)